MPDPRHILVDLLLAAHDDARSRPESAAKEHELIARINAILVAAEQAASAVRLGSPDADERVQALCVAVQENN